MTLDDVLWKCVFLRWIYSKSNGSPFTYLAEKVLSQMRSGISMKYVNRNSKQKQTSLLAKTNKNKSKGRNKIFC